MNVILLIIPQFNYRKIITKKDFLNNNQFYTQNILIETLQAMGLEYKKDFTCDLIILDEN